MIPSICQFLFIHFKLSFQPPLSTVFWKFHSFQLSTHKYFCQCFSEKHTTLGVFPEARERIFKRRKSELNSLPSNWWDFIFIYFIYLFLVILTLICLLRERINNVCVQNFSPNFKNGKYVKSHHSAAGSSNSWHVK